MGTSYIYKNLSPYTGQIFEIYSSKFTSQSINEAGSSSHLAAVKSEA